MNDGLIDSGIDSFSDSDIEFFSVDTTETDSFVETFSDIDNIVSDSLDNDSLLSTDTENNSEIIYEDSTDISISDSVSFSDSSQSVDTVDYLPELEYIDFLLNSQLEQIQSVKTVSGNSINVTIDDSGMEVMTSIIEKQDIVIEGQEIIINLLGCVLLVIVMEYLFNSAKRVMKKMSFRKE